MRIGGSTVAEHSLTGEQRSSRTVCALGEKPSPVRASEPRGDWLISTLGTFWQTTKGSYTRSVRRALACSADGRCGRMHGVRVLSSGACAARSTLRFAAAELGGSRRRAEARKLQIQCHVAYVHVHLAQQPAV